MAKRKDEEEIDEDFILASMNMAGPSTQKKTVEPSEQQKEIPQTPVKSSDVPKEESRRKRIKGDYETLFIRQPAVSGRQEKTTYLRAEFYDRILKIILLYKNPRLSVFAYIDAVMEHHFDQYEQEIMEIYNKRNSAPF